MKKLMIYFMSIHKIPTILDPSLIKVSLVTQNEAGAAAKGGQGRRWPPPQYFRSYDDETCVAAAALDAFRNGLLLYTCIYARADNKLRNTHAHVHDIDGRSCPQPCPPNSELLPPPLRGIAYTPPGWMRKTRTPKIQLHKRIPPVILMLMTPSWFDVISYKHSVLCTLVLPS